MTLLNGSGLARYFISVLALGVFFLGLNYVNYGRHTSLQAEKTACSQSPPEEIVKVVYRDRIIEKVVDGPKNEGEESQENEHIPAKIIYTPMEENGIKYPISDELKKDPDFATFQKRSKFLNNACRSIRSIFDTKQSFKAKKHLHELIKNGQNADDEKKCLPVLAREGSPENHFYTDKEKIHVCLPTKTGSTNWLKMLFSLYTSDGKIDPDEVDPNLVYQMPQLPRFAAQLDEHIRSRQGKDDYFTMITVRHPFARLHSAYKDKFRNKHPWMKYIRGKFGTYLDAMETEDMENEDYEYSFRAFLELMALSEYDQERDRHWKTVQTYCTPCHIDYDFVLKQETAMAENDFLMKVLKFDETHPGLHVPGRYNSNVTARIDMDEIAAPYKGIPRDIIEKIYISYYPDFVLFNYDVDEVFAVAGPASDAALKKKRMEVRAKMKTKFGYYTKRTDDMQCMGDEDYACKYGMWRKFTNHTIVGTAYPFAGKKFTTLTAAFEFGCDKPTVKGVIYDGTAYQLRGGSAGFREHRTDTVWVKQYSTLTIA